MYTIQIHTPCIRLLWKSDHSSPELILCGLKGWYFCPIICQPYVFAPDADARIRGYISHPNVWPRLYDVYRYFSEQYHYSVPSRPWPGLIPPDTTDLLPSPGARHGQSARSGNNIGSHRIHPPPAGIQACWGVNLVSCKFSCFLLGFQSLFSFPV